MPTIAETYNALRQRVQTVITHNRDGDENFYQMCWRLKTPIHATTIQRFLAGMPMRNDTLEKLEAWVEKQETQQTTVPVEPGS